MSVVLLFNNQNKKAMMSTYIRKEKEIPFDVVEIHNDNYDEVEKCWTIDVFGTEENDGTVAAIVYENGGVKELYKNALENPAIMESVFQVLSKEVFKTY